MRRLLSWRVLILAAILALQGAIAPVTHAAGDRVWVNTSSGVYHCPGARYYGNTKRGRFVSEAEAIPAGNHPPTAIAATDFDQWK